MRDSYLRLLMILAMASGACSTPQPGVDAGSGDADRSDARGLDGGAMDATTDSAIRESSTDAIGADTGIPPGFGNRCDGTHACPAALRCIDGTCHLDCSGASHCGSPERCCGASEVCTASGCLAPGASCTPAPGCGGTGVATCPTGSYCDATLARCLPTAGSAACMYPAATSADFRPVESWVWPGSGAHPGYRGVLVTPLVADVNHDGASDVIVAAYTDPPASYGGTISGHAILCALSGAGDCDGHAREIFCTDPADTANQLNAWGNMAVADLDSTDASNALTIVAGLHRGAVGGSGIVAFDEMGHRLWVGHDAAGANVDAFLYLGGVALADLDGNGHAEVIVGGSVFDDTGLLRFTVAGDHSGNAGAGPIAVAADLDVPPDGRLEVIDGNMAYRADGTVLWTSAAIGNGWASVADFDGDGAPEIVVVSNGSVAVLTRTGAVFAPAVTFASLGGSGRGGAPTIADIDRDGTPDIGVAGASQYLALHVVTRGAAHVIQRIWSVPADDASSSITGSGMFDFDGDGVFEVIYQDTCRARVFAGSDGRSLMDIPNISGTATNYPTVADLNGDGRAEFILVTDSYYARSGLIPCPASTPRTDGVRVFRDANDNWQTTRAIWNQHTYHVTNVCDGIDAACDPASNRHGAIPRRERDSWATGFNRYRVNAQFGTAAHPAPDLVPLGLAADLGACPDRVTVRVDVANRGALAVAAGVPVSFYTGDPAAAHTLIGTARTMRAIAPGGTERVQFDYPIPAMSRGASLHLYVVVNDNGMGIGVLRECDAMNNTSGVISFVCDSIG